MITLQPGTRKFLLADNTVIGRNAERGKPGDPAAVIVEVDSEGLATRHVGYAVLALGPVDFEYVQQGAAVYDGQTVYRAAYTTTAEVRIATERGESLE